MPRPYMLASNRRREHDKVYIPLDTVLIFLSQVMPRIKLLASSSDSARMPPGSRECRECLSLRLSAPLNLASLQKPTRRVTVLVTTRPLPPAGEPGPLAHLRSSHLAKRSLAKGSAKCEVVGLHFSSFSYWACSRAEPAASSSLADECRQRHGHQAHSLAALD